MTDPALLELAQRINAAERPRAVLYLSGGGTEVLPWLLARGGGSRTLLSARIPYDPADFRSLLGCDPGPLVDERAARGLAMAAFRHALTIRGDLEPEQVFGIGSTAKLATGIGERPGRAHQIHAALQTSRSTWVWSVNLPEGSDRRWQEAINARLVLHVLALGKGVETEVPPLSHEGWEQPAEAPLRSRSTDDGRIEAVLVGRRPWVGFEIPHSPAGPPTLVEEPPALLMPGSFRPLHDGHVGMARVAESLIGVPCDFELSLFHPEKPPLDFITIRGRWGGFAGQSRRLYFTNAPTYLEKARIFPGCVFVVGVDTMLRIVDPLYYGGIAGRDGALDEMEALEARFLVFGRVDTSGQFRQLDGKTYDRAVTEFLCRTAKPVPERDFRVDLSSTEVRASATDHHP